MDVVYEHRVVFCYSAVRNPSYSAWKVDILFWPQENNHMGTPRHHTSTRLVAPGTHPGTFPPSRLLVMRNARRSSGQHPRMRLGRPRAPGLRRDCGFVTLLRKHSTEYIMLDKWFYSWLHHRLSVTQTPICVLLTFCNQFKCHNLFVFWNSLLDRFPPLF